MHIKDYGFDYDINYYENIGTPARITAVHKGRFAIVSDFGDGYAQLKGKEYYYGNEIFPTVGDFVLIDHNSSGDSRIIKTLDRKTYPELFMHIGNCICKWLCMIKQLQS